MGTKIDLEQLSLEIKGLKRNQKLYRVLKEELSKVGHWKNLARGDPLKAWQSRGKR